MSSFVSGLGLLGSSLISTGGNIYSTMATNNANRRNVDATNAANIQMNNETNQANRDIADAVNQTNMNINQANIDYQREYNQQIFEREDTALSRMAKDASSAGINPLAVMQGYGSGGTAAAPQATLGAEMGSPMQSAKAQSFIAQAPVISGLSSIVSELNQLETGIAQRDLLRQQETKMKNENDFFAENGYYPSQMTEFEKLATAISNAFEGRGKLFDVGEGVGVNTKELGDAIKGRVADSVQAVKDLPSNVEKAGSYVKNAVTGTVDAVKSAKEGDKLSALKDSVVKYAKEGAEGFIDTMEKYSPPFRWLRNKWRSYKSKQDGGK